MKDRPFVGRAADLSFLNEQFACSTNRTQFILLTAPSGGGKTHLIEYFLNEIADTCIIGRGRCWDNWAAVSYHPLREALQMLCPHPETLHPYLRAFLSEDFDGETRALQPQIFFPALCEFLKGKTQKKPLCLFLDDLQWADEGTLEWLDFCLHQQPTLELLILTTCRSKELAAIERFLERLIDARQQGLLQQRELSPLTCEDIAELAKQAAPDKCWNTALVERIWRISDGNPLLALEEICTHSGATDLALSRANPLRSHLDNLPKEARDLLCQAAVLGEYFDVEPLAAALDRESLWVARVLDELWHAHHLIVPDGHGYCFAHARYRELLLESMSPALRRQYHARLAVQETHMSSEQHTYHIVQSSDVRTGARALLKQGDDLRYRANWRDVLRFYNEALWHVKEEGDDSDLLLEIYQRIGDLQMWSAREPELARGYYEVALRWARESRRRVLLMARLGETFLHTPSGHRNLESALCLLGDGGPEPLRDWLEIRLLLSRGVSSL